MANGKVSAQLAPEAVDTILTALETIRAQIPFVVALTTDERRRLAKLGPKSVVFTTLLNQHAQAHPGLVGEAVDLPEFDKDVRLVEALDRFRSELATLAQAVEDTRTVAGAEAMSAALVTYRVFRAAEKNVPGLAAVLDEVGARFRRRGTRTPPDSSGS